MMDTKICKKCGRELPLSEFYGEKGHKDGHMNVCKKCFIQQQKQYNQGKKEEIAEYKKQYYQTQMGRASYLAGSYRQSDKLCNRGECTLTAQWIVDNIFTSKCHWCDETDWNELGCDRIDNDKPHTPDNVIPCCDKCNKKRGTKTYEEFLETLKTPITYV